MLSVYFQGFSDDFQDWLIAQMSQQGFMLAASPSEAEVLLLGTDTGGVDDLTLEALPKSLKQIVMLSSAEVYGEGDFHCGDCGPIVDPGRNIEHFKARRWEVLCPICGEMLMPEPVSEDSLSVARTPEGQRIRALEDALFAQQAALNYPVVILRLFAPYWPTQAPTSFVSRTAQQLLAGETPEVPEDGCQIWDFTYGPDVVQAIFKSLTADLPGQTVLNIGSGSRLMFQEVAAYLQEFLGCEHVAYRLTDEAMPGAVRHRFADIARARQQIGYAPTFDVLTGLKAFSSAMLE